MITITSVSFRNNNNNNKDMNPLTGTKRGASDDDLKDEEAEDKEQVQEKDNDNKAQTKVAKEEEQANEEEELSSIDERETKPPPKKKSRKGKQTTATGRIRRRSSKAERKAGRRSRPLSAYNLFFRDERQRLVDKEDDVLELFKTEVAPHLETPLNPNKALDKFQCLVKLISRRWNNLAKPDRKPYEVMAKQELEEYQARQEREYHSAMMAGMSRGFKEPSDEGSNSNHDKKDQKQPPSGFHPQGVGATTLNPSAYPDSLASKMLLQQQQQFGLDSGSSLFSPSGLMSGAGGFQPTQGMSSLLPNNNTIGSIDPRLLQQLLVAPLDSQAQVSEFVQLIQIFQAQHPYWSQALREVASLRLSPNAGGNSQLLLQQQQQQRDDQIMAQLLLQQERQQQQQQQQQSLARQFLMQSRGQEMSLSTSPEAQQQSMGYLNALSSSARAGNSDAQLWSGMAAGSNQQQQDAQQQQAIFQRLMELQRGQQP